MLRCCVTLLYNERYWKLYSEIQKDAEFEQNEGCAANFVIVFAFGSHTPQPLALPVSIALDFELYIIRVPPEHVKTRCFPQLNSLGNFEDESDLSDSDRDVFTEKVNNLATFAHVVLFIFLLDGTNQMMTNFKL